MSIPIYLQILALITAVIIHEIAHGWMADRLGDPTARLAGRLSPNPLVHIDPYGSVLVPFFLIIIGSPFLIGWAKPVPFDPYNLKNPRRDSAIISLAGPVSNLLLALVSGIIFRILLAFSFPYFFLLQFLLSFVIINVLLAVFNLLPIHPLDGGKIFVGLLPKSEAEDADIFLRRYGLFILLLLIMPFSGRSAISYIINPVLDLVLKLMLATPHF